MTPELPETLRLVAVTLGVPEPMIERTWARHAAWQAENRPGGLLGGPGWEKLCRAVASDVRSAQALPAASLEQIKNREQQRRTRESEERAYDAQAVSLPVWLEGLRRRRTGLDGSLTAVEHAVASAPAPSAGDDVGAWLMAAVRGVPVAPKSGVRAR